MRLHSSRSCPRARVLEPTLSESIHPCGAAGTDAAFYLDSIAANRDPEVFPSPDEFILHRPNIALHLGFGKGRHRCAGSQLARMIVQVAVRDLLETTESFELAGECEGALMPECGIISCPLRMVPRI